MKRTFAATVFAFATFFGSAAVALPTVGDRRPDVTLVDAWGRRLSIDAKANRPILVVYEDKDSGKQNQALKDELSKLAKGGRYRNAVTLLPVADVGAYDYWPAREFVKSAVQSASVDIDTPIYCDWDGSARKAMGLERGTSNVVLYGRDGKVLFAAKGAMSKELRDQLIELVRAQLKP